MKNFLMTLAACGLLASTAVAQEDKGPSYERELGIQLRWTIIGGDLSPGEGWYDFFDDSVGVGLDYALFWRTSEKFEVGCYFGFTYDRFGGRQSTATSEGSTFILEPDPLTVLRNTIGFTCRFKIGEISVAPRLGIGIANYLGGDADLRVGASDVNISAIEPSTEFTWEIGARAGLPIGKQFHFQFGVAYERNGAPDVGFDLDDSLSRFDDQQNVTIDFGLKYVF